MKKFLALILSLVIIFSCTESECARRKSKRSSHSSSSASSAPAGIASLPGTWTASGNGAGSYARNPGENIALYTKNVIFTIEGIKFYESSGEGTADVIFKCEIYDNRNQLRHTRSWEYALPYDVKRGGDNNTWIFSSEFLDGEDKITLTLKSDRTAALRIQGTDWNEDYPDEASAFDVTCEAAKK
ncbi:MAG: hypothetical protein IJQ77_01345 [Synergistaceae bacterium]|nr:hypothetical protein [Synergistaceae bacterium]MBQ3694388.1 hypothetical protein [Synergistaceae bacterium]MBR0249706.1 hypothetical protein [Synergistaceae bacterium]